MSENNNNKISENNNNKTNKINKTESIIESIITHFTRLLDVFAPVYTSSSEVEQILHNSQEVVKQKESTLSSEEQKPYISS
jgi:hypothetical protein